MWNKVRETLNYVCWFWFLGGGCALSLFGFVWTWKLALSIFCIWLCSLIVALLKCLADGGILTYTKQNKRKE